MGLRWLHPRSGSRAVHRELASVAHLGVGIWEVELIQTVFSRVQQAAHSQRPISTGDKTRMEYG